METASVVFEHKFDESMLSEIESLRMIRLSLAEKLLNNLTGTVEEMMVRGLISQGSGHREVMELRGELTGRIRTLRDRLSNKGVIYADEIELYIELLESTESEAEEIIPT
jgi:hypothetical protein